MYNTFASALSIFIKHNTNTLARKPTLVYTYPNPEQVYTHLFDTRLAACSISV